LKYYSFTVAGGGWSNLTAVATSPSPRHQQAHQRLARQLADIGPVVPGSITARMTRCGTPGCRCQANPPQLHGPYPTWTRAVAGKTITRQLNPDQASRYQPWVDNARTLRDLVRQLRALGVVAAEQAEGWAPAP